MRRISVAGTAPGTGTDGLGQGLFRDLLWFLRFRKSHRVAIPWRDPSPAEKSWIEAHPRLARFGDHTIAVAEHAGRRWIVRENDFFGWPDGPRYVAFALDGESVWMAWGFNTWPAGWNRRPEPG